MRTRSLTVLLIAGLVLTLTGCGRTYHIKGRVVMLPQLGNAESVIAEITGQEIPTGGRPIEGAKVRMLHQLDKNGRPLPDSVWERDALTDAGGNFDISSYAAPSDNVPVGLEISKEGFKTAYTVYIDHRSQGGGEKTQVFFVVLAPNASLLESPATAR
jgi:hypothetical protein